MLINFCLSLSLLVDFNECYYCILKRSLVDIEQLVECLGTRAARLAVGIDAVYVGLIEGVADYFFHDRDGLKASISLLLDSPEAEVELRREALLTVDLRVVPVFNHHVVEAVVKQPLLLLG